ncbi:ribonuclease H2 subunit B [Parasteatoda tepidariorum]|uniref:ribonuclease H2 subunit B n=1 Tax=Parasteatoda tepidariorum TaxID=114398 RepID=UPI001C721A31|nr:ribonuclease H2 subunit B [Parasteatoda tepidariorum]
MSSEITQRVFLIPTSNNQQYSVVKLKHPRTNSPTLCAIDSSHKLYEIVHYAEEFSSWLVDDSVIEDGSLFLMNIADPLFYILPYVNKDGKYCLLEDLLVDENYSDVHLLVKCCSEAELTNVFDFKESSGYKVFCYNKTKTLHWLQKKVQYLVNTLKSKNIDIADGAKAASLQTNIENEDPKILTKYSCDLISEYLSEDLYDELLQCLGIEKELMKKQNGTPVKSKKQNTAVDPVDDYSKKYDLSKSQDKQQSKLTPAQKRLQKGDKTGMRSISSFFQRK